MLKNNRRTVDELATKHSHRGQRKFEYLIKDIKTNSRPLKKPLTSGNQLLQYYYSERGADGTFLFLRRFIVTRI